MLTDDTLRKITSDGINSRVRRSCNLALTYYEFRQPFYRKYSLCRMSREVIRF